MEILWNEVQNLKATAKSWEIVTLRLSGKVYPFDSKYANWNYVVLTGFMGAVGDGYVNWLNNGSINVRSRNLNADNYEFKWNKSGNSIVPSQTREFGNGVITVLFYK